MQHFFLWTSVLWVLLGLAVCIGSSTIGSAFSWTSQLGEAYHNQKSEVMSAILALRSQAKAAGNLKSTPQMTVVQQTPQTIVIEPADPDVVYVPQYNPAVIYGYPSS